ncbi:MAG TPA: PQQ-binding-like beta-propeller repeat protein [Candidatus Tumulicola sp.]
MKGSFVVMRGIRKIASAIALLGFPVLFASGCAASGTAGSPFTPISPAANLPVSPEARGVAPNAKTVEWPQFGYNRGHSAYNPLETTIGTNNVSKLKIGWNDSSIIQPSGIVYDKNLLYVNDMGQTNAGLYAFNAATGAQKWFANVNLNGGWGSFNRSVSAVAGNMVVTPCSNGSTTQFLTGLCGVNATNGKVVWKTYCTLYQGSGCEGLINGTSPAYDGKNVIVQITQGVNEQPDTEAFNPKTGASVWDVAGIYHCPDAGLGSGAPLPVAGGNVLAVLGCQGTSGGTEICALNAASGSQAWCYQSPNVYVQSMIADATKFYVIVPGGSTSTVIAFNAKSGAQIWKASIPAQNGSVMAVDPNRLYVENGANGLYALKASTGKPVWSYTANGNMIVGGSISVANDIVYTNGGGGNNDNVAIAAFNSKSGKLIYSTSSVSNGSAPATGIIVNGTVYTGCYTLCAFTLPGK